MSRIGKKAIAVPSGVTANIEGQTVKIKGPKGALAVALHDDVDRRHDLGAACGRTARQERAQLGKRIGRALRDQDPGPVDVVGGDCHQVDVYLAGAEPEKG